MKRKIVVILKVLRDFFVSFVVFFRCCKLGIKYKSGCYIGHQVTKSRGTKIVLSKHSRIASYCRLWGGGIITIGEHSSVGEYSWIFSHRNGGVTIGDFVNVAAFLYLIDSDHGMSLSSIMLGQSLVSSCVTIGNDVWIGANVTILKGVNIDNGCVVGAGSVVTKSFPTNSIVAGNPARLIKQRV